PRAVGVPLACRAVPAARLRDARPLPVRATPALRRLAARLLVDTDDDGGAPPLRGHDHRLHPRRDPARGTGPGRGPRRAVRRVPAQRPDAGTTSPRGAAGADEDRARRGGVGDHHPAVAPFGTTAGWEGGGATSSSLQCCTSFQPNFFGVHVAVKKAGVGWSPR